LGIEQRFGKSYAEAIPLEFAPADRGVRSPRLDLAAKRALDVVLASIFSIALLPLFAFVALTIWLDSGGPVLFRQTRLGLNGKPFDIIKFRTMTVLENGDRVVQARRNDPRVTRVGRFLRNISIDELPQLINVLKGEMSLVGPRPHARAHDEYYAVRIDQYMRRQAMKPGITGWAQVNGFRGETPTIDSMLERVDCDLWYVDHFSLALDLEVLVRTLIEIVRQRNVH